MEDNDLLPNCNMNERTNERTQIYTKWTTKSGIKKSCRKNILHVVANVAAVVGVYVSSESNFVVDGAWYFPDIPAMTGGNPWDDAQILL